MLNRPVLTLAKQRRAVSMIEKSVTVLMFSINDPGHNACRFLLNRGE